METETKPCPHLFTESGNNAKCVRCGQSMLGVQLTTERPSPRQELQNKLRELDKAELAALEGRADIEARRLLAPTTPPAGAPVPSAHGNPTPPGHATAPVVK